MVGICPRIFRFYILIRLNILFNSIRNLFDRLAELLEIRNILGNSQESWDVFEKVTKLSEIFRNPECSRDLSDILGHLRCFPHRDSRPSSFRFVRRFFGKIDERDSGLINPVGSVDVKFKASFPV